MFYILGLICIFFNQISCSTNKIDISSKLLSKLDQVNFDNYNNSNINIERRNLKETDELNWYTSIHAESKLEKFNKDSETAIWNPTKVLLSDLEKEKKLGRI